MSNLGYLSVYQMLNARDDTLCERFFLPDPDDLKEHRRSGFPLFSLESKRALGDFDVVAFSLSFENDYLNLPVILDLGGLPLWREERGEGHPLLLAGGVCAFMNPEPLAEIFDLFAVGEAEVLLPTLLATLQQDEITRDELLINLAQQPGFYVPSYYTPHYDPEGTLLGYHVEQPAPKKVARQWQADLDQGVVRGEVQTRETEFGEMSLVEVSRGCSRGCRFCVAGYLFLPPREHQLDNLKKSCQQGLQTRKRLGLVGAAVSDYPDLGALQAFIDESGGESSLASLRIDALSEEDVLALKQGGHRTVALAPEAGSQRLRDHINKGLDEEQILNAVRILAAGEILNLKLYFLVGLPEETDEDIEELLALVTKARDIWVEEGKKLGRLGTLLLSVNPFVPKPFTPLQWAAMPREAMLKKTMRRLQSAVGRMANVEFTFESVRASILQALLARGDRRVGKLLPQLAEGQKLKPACRDLDLDPDAYVHRERLQDEVFPWEILDSGVTRAYLWKEYLNAHSGKVTPRCSAGCSRCGVCS